MRRLTSIVAVSVDGAIGAQNRLPWRVRSDLRFFREQTKSHVVIMGRKTFDSLGGCLPDRTNIVVTHGFGMFASTPHCKAAGSIDEAIVMAEDCRTSKQDVFVIGGSSMYEQFSPYVDRYLVTEIDKTVSDADAFFDPRWIGDLARWQISKIGSGRAQPPMDEADYAMFEFARNDADEMAARRQHLIDSARRRRAPSRKTFNHERLRAFG